MNQWMSGKARHFEIAVYDVYNQVFAMFVLKSGNMLQDLPLWSAIWLALWCFQNFALF